MHGIEGTVRTMSMTIEYLSKCKGASKFGNCVNCGVSSGDSKDLTWISFAPNNSGYHTTICLCRKCRFVLASEILSEAVREDGENHDES